MVQAICVGDPHFKTSNVPDIKEFIEKSVTLVKNTKPDFVVLLGDILDKHERYDEEPYNLAMEWLWQS